MAYYVHKLKQDSAAHLVELDSDPFLGSISRGESSRPQYVRFLQQTYHYVHQSGPLLATAGERLRANGQHPWLVGIFQQKTREEAPHDRWALADLKALGQNTELARASAPSSAVKAYIALNQAMPPVSFLGVAYALEFISEHRAKIAATNLCARGKIRNIHKAVTFLRGHGSADEQHVRELAAILRRIDEPRDQQDILLAAANTRMLYRRFFA